jgi:2-polyprenyl-3-methyl-5-hydroxy-6-metoxy-1,4-benzoquinol methylase
MKKLVEHYHQWRRKTLPPSQAVLEWKLGAINSRLDAIELHVKTFGYQLARDLSNTLPKLQHTNPEPLGLSSRPTRQAEFEQPWFRHWCQELQIPLVYSRKLWEYAFVLQSLHDSDLLEPGRRCLGFGCGAEPLSSYFAARGLTVTATDLEPSIAQGKGWIETGQHATTVDQAFHTHLVDRPTFDANVTLRYVDMNAIDESLRGYDFCWSICALEHLGSIANGLAFIAKSLDTLRPGGLALHTTEFNYLNDEETIDHDPSLVLFQRRHFIEIVDRLRSEGHEVASLSFDVGDGPLDRFIDIPPFAHSPHLKLAIGKFPCTCFGLAITKKRAS